MILIILKNIFFYIIARYSYEILIENTLNELINENIIYIKLFQALSSNKYFSLAIINQFKKCTNHSNYCKNDIDDELLSKILESYNVELCDKNPINSGMIALIYKGKTKEGNYVILKIKRKNIE
jgi:predicted unusual protein kinase regulating ubiquinone biosynthesis (AarF/ABC1/UbiB family)